MHTRARSLLHGMQRADLRWLVLSTMSHIRRVGRIGQALWRDAVCEAVDNAGAGGSMIDVTGQPDVARAYAHLGKRSAAGKGDLSRNNFSEAFRANYDRIFNKRQRRNERRTS
jgi:hypothetical protein